MTRDPFASARRKWARGEYHRDMLEADFKRLDEFDTESSGLQFHPEPSTQRIEGDLIHVEVTVALGDDVPTLSAEFPLIIGDAIHNYRAGLDHLTWSIVRRFSPGLSAKQRRQIQFPMHNSAADFMGCRPRRLPGVPTTHCAFIKRYQPYRRGEGPAAIRWLRRLSDSDKHRELIPTVMAPKGVLVKAHTDDRRVRLVKLTPLITGPHAIYPGTPIAKLLIATSAERGKTAVKVDTQFELFPSLRRRRHPGGLLLSISQTVAEIIDGMEALG